MPGCSGAGDKAAGPEVMRTEGRATAPGGLRAEQGVGSARGVQQRGRGPGPSWWGYRGVPQGFEDRKGCPGPRVLETAEVVCTGRREPALGVRAAAVCVRAWGPAPPWTLPPEGSALTWYPGLPVSWPQEDGSSAHVSCSPLSGSSHVCNLGPPSPPVPSSEHLPLATSRGPTSQAGFSIFILKQPLLRVLCSWDLSELTRALGLWDWNDDADDVSTKPRSHLDVFWEETWGRLTVLWVPLPTCPEQPSQVLAARLSIVLEGSVTLVTVSQGWVGGCCCYLLSRRGDGAAGSHPALPAHPAECTRVARPLRAAGHPPPPRVPAQVPFCPLGVGTPAHGLPSEWTGLQTPAGPPFPLMLGFAPCLLSAM